MRKKKINKLFEEKRKMFKSYQIGQSDDPLIES